MGTVRKVLVVAAATLAVLAPAACSSGSGSGDGARVSVLLTDYAVTATPASEPAGKLTFKVNNNGSFVHEMLVVKADSIASLPLKADGTVDEDAIPEAQRPGEVPDIGPGKSGSLTVTLPAGKYILLCNRVDGSISHYHEGMHTDFIVT